MFLAFFGVHKIYFPQNFEIFIFLAVKFSLMLDFIFSFLVAKLVIKGCCFWSLWTASDQNLCLRSSLTIQIVDQPCFISQISVCMDSIHPSMYQRISQSPCRIGLKKNFAFAKQGASPYCCTSPFRGPILPLTLGLVYGQFLRLQLSVKA